MLNRAETFIKRITTTSSAKPSVEDLFFKNVRNNDVRIMNIGYVPNKDFLIRGNLLVEIEGQPTLLQTVANDFIDIADVNQNFQEIGGLRLEKNRKIKSMVKIKKWTFSTRLSALHWSLN